MGQADDLTRLLQQLLLLYAWIPPEALLLALAYLCGSLLLWSGPRLLLPLDLAQNHLLQRLVWLLHDAVQFTQLLLVVLPVLGARRPRELLRSGLLLYNGQLGAMERRKLCLRLLAKRQVPAERRIVF